MGVLETMVAVRDVEVDAVAAAVVGLCADAGVATAWHRGDARAWARHDVSLHDAGRWVMVRPHYIVDSEHLAVALTTRLGTLASATSIYEDMLWTHHLVDEGRVLDRFCNIPEYFGPGEYGPEWRGDPDLVAAVLGVAPAPVRPYFRQFSVRRINLLGLLRLEPRAHRGDRAHLLDGWATQDLWARLGIAIAADDPAAGLVPLTSDESSALSDHLAGRG